MQLIRWGNAYRKQKESKIYVYREAGEDVVRAAFRSFGNGYERTGDFSVELDWEDVGELIRSHARIGNPEAIRFQNALKLASAVESAGWQSQDAPREN